MKINKSYIVVGLTLVLGLSINTAQARPAFIVGTCTNNDNDKATSEAPKVLNMKFYNDGTVKIIPGDKALFGEYPENIDETELNRKLNKKIAMDKFSDNGGLIGRTVFEGEKTALNITSGTQFAPEGSFITSNITLTRKGPVDQKNAAIGYDKLRKENWTYSIYSQSSSFTCDITMFDVKYDTSPDLSGSSSKEKGSEIKKDL